MVQILVKSASFVAIIITAYLLKRFGLFGPKDYKIVTKLVLNVTLPCAVITSFASYQPELTLLVCTAIGFLMNWFMLGIAFCISRKGCLSSRALWLNCCPGYNIGTFALPFVQSFLSPACVVACCLFDAGSATMCSGGTYALSCGILGENGTFSFKQIGGKLIRSVPFMSYVVMLIVTVLGVTIPQGLVSFVKPVANANPFLAMFMIGLMFDTRVEKGKFREVAGILAIRTGLAVAASMACLFLLPLELPIRQALAITLFAPVSVTSTAYSEKVGADPAEAGCLNSLSIPISIVGITAMLVIFGVM